MSVVTQLSGSVNLGQSNFRFHPDIKVVTFTGVSCSGKNRRAEALQRVFATPLIQSVTTRQPRGDDQDAEYQVVSLAKFARMTNKMLWAFTSDETGDSYGTNTLDINRALESDHPSVMHLVHDRVAELQEYGVKIYGKPCVFSFVVTCEDVNELIGRWNKRNPNVDPGSRFHNVDEKQSMYRQSGLFHALLESDLPKSDDDIINEIKGYLCKSIPQPQKF